MERCSRKAGVASEKAGAGVAPAGRPTELFRARVLPSSRRPRIISTAADSDNPELHIHWNAG